MSVTAMHRPLIAEDLLPDGPLRRLGRCVRIHDTLDSTNTYLLDNATDLGDGAIAHAEFQRSGRGRLGRRWEAPRGSSILLSALLLEPNSSRLLQRAGLVAAVAACEAVEEQTDCHPNVRWPNDLAVDGRKLGGVLIETRGIDEVRRALAMGIGINCLQQPGHFSPALQGKATSLECASERAIDRAPLAAALVRRLNDWLVRCEAGDWSALQSAWHVRCADLGTRVTLQCDGRSYAGTAVEVTLDGDLDVELDYGGRRRFASSTTARIW